MVVKRTTVKIEHLVLGLIVLFIVSFLQRAAVDAGRREADQLFR